MQVSLCVKRQPGLLRTNLCEENLKKKKICVQTWLNNGDSLSKNDSHTLRYLNTWSPVDETVWKGLGAVLGHTCHWKQAMRLQNSEPFPLSCACGSSCKLSVTAQAPHLPVDAMLPIIMTRTHPLCNCEPPIKSSLSYPGLSVLAQQ